MSHHSRDVKGGLHILGPGEAGPERRASAPPSTPSLVGQLLSPRPSGGKEAGLVVSAGS